MPLPSDKNPSIEKTLASVFGFDRRDSIRELKCVPKPIGCGKTIPIDEWLNSYTAIEQNEYKISGLCVDCQKEVFGY